MKTSSVIFRFVAVLLLVVTFAACNSAGQKVVVIPTLAVLPSVSPTAQPPTVTPTPSAIPTATNTPLPTMTLTPVMTSTHDPLVPIAGNWHLITNTDPFDNTTSAMIDLEADAPVQAWLSTVTPSLEVYCQGSSFLVAVNAGSQLETDLDNNLTVRMRFDQETAETHTATATKSGDAFVFPGEAVTLTRKILGHQKLLIGYTPFSAAPVAASFDLAGATKAVNAMRGYCSLPL